MNVDYVLSKGIVRDDSILNHLQDTYLYHLEVDNLTVFTISFYGSYLKEIIKNINEMS